MSQPARTRRDADLDQMKDAIRACYKDRQYEVNFPDQNIPVGNAQIDGEIIVTNSFKIAVELKGPGDDDVVKGIGQLIEAGADSYQQGMLVVTERRGRTVRRTVFKRIGIGLMTVDVRGNVKFLVEARNLEL